MKLTPSHRSTLLVMCLCVAVTGVDNTVLNVALPSIVRELGATGSQLQWIVDAYTTVFACLLLTAGAVGDRYGRKGALSFGLVWFGLCSILAAEASSPLHLIVARGLMGIGGAFIYPTTLSILTNTFTDPKERGRAIGVWAGVSGVGIAIGPLVGGLLIERFGWASVFFVNGPLCTAVVVLVQRYVPRIQGHRLSRPDPAGAVLSILAMFPLLYAIIEAPNLGWADERVVGSFAVSVLVFGTFIWWERRVAEPMLDVRFFQNARFTAASATISITYFALFASTFLLTQYFQFMLGYSPLKAGMLITPIAAGLMIGAPSAPRWVERWGTTRVVVSGLLILATCMACYASDTLMSSFAIGIGVRILWGLGIGTASAPVTESIMGSLPPHRAGVGSAVNDTTRQVGGALGVAMLGSIFAAQYHLAIGDLSFVPSTMRQSARESIGSSLQVARRLPAEAGFRLQTVAHGAFLAAQRVTFGVGLAIIMLAVVVAWRFLPARSRTHATSSVDALPATAELGSTGV